jgi:hypothetical protein
VIIREICPQRVGQGRCELVVCVASEKNFSIPTYPALESSDCRRTHACVFVWAYLKIDFAKRLDILKRGQINIEESAGSNLSYIGSPRNAACQQGFRRRLRSQVVFDYDRMNCVRHFSISHYFAELD